MIEFLNGLAAAWASWALAISWQVAVLATFVLALDLLVLRRAWPQVRYALWLLVLVRLVTPPGFALWSSVSPRVLTAAADRTPAFVPDWGFVSTVGLSWASTPAQARHPTLTVSAYAMLFSIAVSLFLFGWTVARLRRLRRLGQADPAASAPPAWINQLVAECAARLKLRRVPRVIINSQVPTAAVCGIFRPVILLPSGAESFGSASMEHILLHELAHIRRGDHFVNGLQTLLQLLFWFHPAVWLAGARLRHLREACCDGRVSNLLRAEKTRDYCRTLVMAADRMAPIKGEAVMGLMGLFEHPSHLRERLRYLGGPAWKYRRMRTAAALSAAALLFFCVLPMAGQRAHAQPATTPTASSDQDINAKVAKLNLETATREDVIAVFGEPTSYVWGGKTFTKDNLPNAYIMAYPGLLNVEMFGGQVEELRFGENNGPSDYIFGDGLRVGSSLEEALKVIGPPDKTVEGGEIGFADGVLYKNSHFTSGDGQSRTATYYARRSKGVRIFLFGDKVAALYVTRKGLPPSFGGAGLAEGPPVSDYNSKVAKLDLEKATRGDIIAVFGEPVSYRWSGKTFTKDNLPSAYVMYYNNVFCVEILNDQVEELRFSQKSDYVFGDGLRYGSSLEEALKVIGAPDLTVDLKGGKIGFDDGVLYKNGQDGVGYYARRKRGVRIFTRDEEVSALYVTRKSHISWTAEQEKNRIVDRTDYPFVDDPVALGKWVSVDFVKNIEDFRPGEKQWSSSLYLTDLNFHQGGEMVRTFTSGIKKNTDSSNTWTKGLVLSKEGQTASAYTIKTLDGKNYLFYEWKSGDYAFGHMKPYYYVLTQASGEN